MIARWSAVKKDLLADGGYVHKVDVIGDPLQKIEAVVDFCFGASGRAHCSPSRAAERWSAAVPKGSDDPCLGGEASAWSVGRAD